MLHALLSSSETEALGAHVAFTQLSSDFNHSCGGQTVEAQTLFFLTGSCCKHLHLSLCSLPQTLLQCTGPPAGSHWETQRCRDGGGIRVQWEVGASGKMFHSLIIQMISSGRHFMSAFSAVLAESHS